MQAATVKRHCRLRCFGKGRNHTMAWWKAFARLAMLMGVTKSTSRQMSGGTGRYQALMLGPKGAELLRRASVRCSWRWVAWLPWVAQGGKRRARTTVSRDAQL